MRIQVLSGMFLLILSVTHCYGHYIKKDLEYGLTFYNFVGDYKNNEYNIYVLKSNPKLYSLKLLMASKLKTRPLSLKEWAIKYQLIAVINASMFWEDRSTSTGFMKSKDYVNQKLIHKKFGGFLVFNPKFPDLPEVTIIEKDKNNKWKKIISKYENVIQNYRMIGQNKQNLWHRDKNKYSVSAIAMDTKGNIDFIFSYKPLSIHILNEVLLDLPLDISSCLFTEGGSTCGIYVKYKDFEIYLSGQSNINFLSTNKIPKIPNIIGLVKK